MSIFGWKGDRHNLSKGAFDSVSVVKPGNASLLLAEYMGRTFDESFAELTKGYKKIVASEWVAQKGMSVWRDHIRPGLKKAGGWAWELAKPVVMDALAVAAGMSPTAAALVASAETMFSVYLEGLAVEPVESRSLVLNKGSWVFIEKEESLKRRRRLKGISANVLSPGTVDLKRRPKSVEFGFYIMPAYNDPSKVTVFNIDAGSTQEVEVRQVRPAGPDVSKMVEADEQLSVLRELFFYKTSAGKFETDHPKSAVMPGRNVVYAEKDFTLIETDGVHALVVDPKGHTKIVPYDDLTRGVGKSTPGHGDNFFDKSNGRSLYSGQWVMVPASLKVIDEYGVNRELGVVFEIEKDGMVDVFYCMDGTGYRVKESTIEAFPPNLQQLYSSKQPFKLFKLAATQGDMEKTSRYELGSRFAEICLNDYEHTVKYLGSAEPTKTTTKTPVNVTKVGNTTKDKVDAREEVINKTGLSSAEVDRVVDEAWDRPQGGYAERTGGGGDDGGMLLGIIAIGALVLIAFGGAAA